MHLSLRRGYSSKACVAWIEYPTHFTAGSSITLIGGMFGKGLVDKNNHAHAHALSEV